jgi:hypothetical protein
MDLLNAVDNLPSGPCWRADVLDPSGFATKEPMVVYYRDGVECIQSLFGHPIIYEHLQLVPTQLFDRTAPLNRTYHGWNSGDNAWSIQVASTHSPDPVFKVLIQSNFHRHTYQLEVHWSESSFHQIRRLYPTYLVIASLIRSSFRLPVLIWSSDPKQTTTHFS